VRVKRRVACCLLCTLIALASAAASQVVHFTIRAQQLTDALDRFGEQSGLQVVYEQSLLEGRSTPGVIGDMSAREALELLLRSSDLVWSFVNDQTVLIQKRSAPTPPATVAKQPKQPVASPHSEITTLGIIRVNEDPRRVLPNESSASVFGFDKSLLETPRSISFISEETIDLFGLSAVEDLLRVVPGVYTTTRFGIQGAVDIRNVPADTFFRGMRRLSLQGHGRSVLAAMDTIEIVGGPPSPLYGMGKIGGYANLVPKSGRARVGGYLTATQGFAQLIGGNYDRREASFGVGGPLSALQRFERRGGYYVYGLVEDSASFAAGVPIQQQVLQAATNVDQFLGPFRLETGASLQVSRTAGALTGRFTQDLVDTGRYIRGAPLIDLDANHNGRIGFLEMQRGSPVRGNLALTNQPLLQTWNWPTDGNGQPVAIDAFPVVPGIPEAMYDYLVAHPEADPTGLLRAQGVGGPLPQSGAVPIGFVLDPRTVGYGQLDDRRAGAFEKYLKARFTTAFLDLVSDDNPDVTVRNQLFFDRMDQYKNSNQPFVQQQSVYVVEDKFTLTQRWQQLPAWLRVNMLASLNARNTVSRGATAGADFASHRSDVMASTWREDLGGMTPNTTFESPLDNADLATDGYPWSTIYQSSFSEFGVGVLFDIDVGSRWNLLLGGRYDWSQAKNVDYAESFNPITGTAANPGAYFGVDARTAAWDDGASWSASLSYSLPYNIRPYFTAARSSIVLDGNNNMLTNAVITAGHIGTASLHEIGVKASLLEGRLAVTFAAFEQAREAVDDDDANALLYAYPTATLARGWTAELKWVPVRNLFVALYAMKQNTRFDPNVGSVQLVDARTLGFQDVRDAQGNVIYPAEAFLYGGRSRIVLPANLTAFEDKQGSPETQFGFNSSYQWNSGFGLTVSANYLSSTCSGRLCTVRLPQSYVANAGVFLDLGAWTLKLDASNLFNERYFRARTGDTLGNPLAQVMPDRRWQLTARMKF
jgi:outer membrane receptor protein involved in Fe transport